MIMTQGIITLISGGFLALTAVATAAPPPGGVDPMVAAGGIAANLVAGLFMKHVIKRLPNVAIPFVNVGLSTVAAGVMSGWDPGTTATMGLTWGLGATGVHQPVKLLTGWGFSKMIGRKISI
jgi:uncharacterized membrane protein (DUF4010 family)